MSSAVCNDHDILNAIEAVSGAKAKGQQRDSLRFHPFPARMPLSLGRHLIDETITAEAENKQPMQTSIFIEEAHRFLSAQRIQKMQVLFQQVARIAHRGRKC